MSIVSEFLLQTCTITRYGIRDDFMGNANTTVYNDVPCRFSREQKQIRLPDGTFTIANGKMLLDESANVEYGDMVAIDNAEYKVIGIKETRDFDGTIAKYTVYLG